MNSLRARIAIMLVVAISGVVVLATGTTILVVNQTLMRRHFQPAAEQLEWMTNHVDRASLASAETSDPPSSRRSDRVVDDHLTPIFQDALGRLHDGRRVVIYRRSSHDGPIASVELAPDLWISIPIEDVPTPPWIVLGGWIAFVIAGTTGISLVVAQRVTRSLALLETVAANIRFDGRLDPIPEQGPVEIKVTARALNQMSEKLRRAMESRMRLVAAAGHDLRTPMTRMRLRAEFLNDADRGKWLHDLDELAQIADSAIRLVREEVDDRGGEIIRLDSMANAIVSELASMNLSVVVRETAPLQITGTPLALARAFRNLIINAAIHGGGAEVGVETLEGNAVFVIQDRGPGIPDNLLDRVFEPFFRVDPARRHSAPGAGLGLAIAHEIVARAGGRLSLQNRAGGGLRQEAAFPMRLEFEVENELA